MKTALLSLLIASTALADTMLRNAGVNEGPVTILNCVADGGLGCDRPTGTSRGDLTCNSASSTEKGCVSLSAQTLGHGIKNFAASVTIDGGLVVSASVKAEQGQFIGPTASDGGIGRLNLANGRDVAAFTTVGIQAIDGVNLPHSAGINGFVLGGAGQGLAAKVVMKERMPSPGQFTRISVTVDRVGSGDGGLSSDGGPTQGFQASVYNRTAGAYLCNTAHTACNVSGSFSTACALDGGARFTTADDVELQVHNIDCLDAPSINVGGRYVGPTSP